MNLSKQKERLLERDTEWSKLAAEGTDVERILSYWTDDAVVLPPGLPAVVGKEALRQYVESSMQIPGFRITWTTSEVTLSPDERFAYMFSRNEVMMNAPDGTPMTTVGRAITIWRREADSEWRCAVEIWNAEPPA